MKTKICPNCKKQYEKNSVFCSSKCYYSFPKSEEIKRKISEALKDKAKSAETCRKISDSTKGKPKPWNIGSRNPNYQNKAQSKAKEKFLQACKIRGQVWTAEHKKQHSKTMSGPANKMRGKKHTLVTIKQISNTKIEQYKNGLVKFKQYRISKAEKEIADFLKENKIEFVPQYQIQGISYIYDFYIPKLNLIIEYQGDYWHANPMKYNSGSLIKIKNVGETLVDDIWKKDKKKFDLAVEKGYVVNYIWESDYKKSNLELVKQLIKEIKIA